MILATRRWNLDRCVVLLLLAGCLPASTRGSNSTSRTLYRCALASRAQIPLGHVTYARSFQPILGVPGVWENSNAGLAANPGAQYPECRTDFPFALPAAQPDASGRSATRQQDSASDSVVSNEPTERQVGWKTVVPNFLSDQKHIWLFPLHLAEGKHWKPTLAAIGVTAGLVALDPHTAPYFRHTNKFLEFNNVFKVTTTERVFLGLPVVYYFVGLARRDSYAQQTAFFAAETIADVDLLAGVMRSVDGRLHPRDIPLNGDYTHTWFKAKGTYLNRGSFPSGHTAGAFAVATIFAERYKRRHPWVPWVAYPLAALVGVSRITDSAHFPSDVFMGGVLAYSIGRYVVLRGQ
jgi:membrane-associated PAP2 superfamily phosphatase